MAHYGGTLPPFRWRHAIAALWHDTSVLNATHGEPEVSEDEELVHALAARIHVPVVRTAAPVLRSTPPVAAAADIVEAAIGAAAAARQSRKTKIIPTVPLG